MNISSLLLQSILNSVFLELSRPKLNRRICEPAIMDGFKPYGICRKKFEKVNLLLEEYESIKLIDYENLIQEQAVLKIGVSRPTITRIYENAR